MQRKTDPAVDRGGVRQARFVPFVELSHSPAWPRGAAALCKAVLFVAALAGCQPDQAADGGSNAMFGLFKGKTAPLASVVAPEVGAVLKRESAFPSAIAPLPVPDYNQCTPVGVAGRPPQATFTKEAIDGETSTGFRVAAAGGQPPLAIANILTDNPKFEIWQLGSDKQPAFVTKRPLHIDPAQASWRSFLAMDGACLPGHRMMLGVSYTDPATREALYVYDIAANSFRKIGLVQPDSSKGPPFRYFETWPASHDTAMVLFHTDGLRLRAEVYASQYDHLMLYSPRHLDGLEVLKLGLDDGNVQRWAMVGKTLWLQTIDRRNGAAFIWSLDLTKVL